LANNPIVERAARFMQRNKIHHLPSLNLLIGDMAAKVLEDAKHSAAIVGLPKPVL